MKELKQQFKDLIEKYPDREYYIQTRNKETNWVGCAIFIPGEEKIRVFEGDSEGADDRTYTYEEFKKKYFYMIRQEIVGEE